MKKEEQGGRRCNKEEEGIIGKEEQGLGKKNKKSRHG